MKNQKRILAVLILGVTMMLQAEGEKARKDLIPIFKKCYRPDEHRTLVASSVLTEKGKPKNYYGPNNIDDQYIDTAWGVSKNQGIGEWIYTYNDVDSNKNSYELLAEKSQKNYFSFLNGLAKDATLFEENGRIKRVRIDVYELEGGETMANLDDPLIYHNYPIENDSFELELKDTPEEQTFEREIFTKIKPQSIAYDRYLLFKLTILETYPGTKSKNVFLTEFLAYSKDRKEGFKITRERN
ncbi:NADase-type glycan-binding domain-containing protein [Leptospira alstonii]|uniref:NADase-type glycan-binding domain-containing protein n=1 Tax=Leptospira alstonii TaxID=28452 RepID=UPI000A4DB35F